MDNTSLASDSFQTSIEENIVRVKNDKLYLFSFFIFYFQT